MDSCLSFLISRDKLYKYKHLLDALEKCVKSLLSISKREKFIPSENKGREETWTSLRKNRYRLRLRRIPDADSGKRVVGMTRRVSPKDPAATNRLIRWIYDGWRGEIGSWPRVNLACVKAGKGFQRREPGENGRREIDFLRDLCHYFLSEDAAYCVTAPGGMLSSGVCRFSGGAHFISLYFSRTLWAILIR